MNCFEDIFNFQNKANKEAVQQLKVSYHKVRPLLAAPRCRTTLIVTGWFVCCAYSCLLCGVAAYVLLRRLRVHVSSARVHQCCEATARRTVVVMETRRGGEGGEEEG